MLKTLKRNPTETAEHSRLILMMAEHFKKLGYIGIRADLKAYPKPGKILGRVPDLTCNKRDKAKTLVVLEAETCGSIFDEHTQRQWRAFSASALALKGEFHIVVPKTCGRESGRTLARRRLRELNISCDEIWSPS